MKKRHTIKIIGSLVLLVTLIIGISLISYWLLKRDSQKLELVIDAIEKSAEAGDWTQAETNVEKAGDIWSGVKGIWSALIDHNEIDNIDVTLSRLQTLVQVKEAPSALSEAAALRKYIGHIPQKEKLNLDNIF